MEHKVAGISVTSTSPEWHVTMMACVCGYVTRGNQHTMSAMSSTMQDHIVEANDVENQ